MSRIMIPYGTCEGHTALIVACIADVIRNEGHEAFPVVIEREDAPAPDGYDAVAVGASVHRGRHQVAVEEYVRKHRAALERLPSAFFSVSLAVADGSAEGRREADRYVEEFFRQTGWRAGMVGLFAGALLYTRYGFFLRWIMKRIARSRGSTDTDTSRDYVYTDWEAVRSFAREFVECTIPRACEVGWGAGQCCERPCSPAV
jgi:menaquinone-dependent protoporphyrinogen oxidase